MCCSPLWFYANDQEVLAFFITELQKLFPKTIFIRIEPQWRTTQLATIKKAMEILIISPDQLSSCSIAFFLRSVYDFHPKECEDA
jgi:hypothetical protein